MNKEQIIDEVYERYSKEYEKDSSIGFRLRHKDKNGNPTYGKGNKESFINKCKTDDEFSQKWGLTIEERELSLRERFRLIGYSEKFYFIVEKAIQEQGEEFLKMKLNESKIPTKVITTKYKNETIESYE